MRDALLAVAEDVYDASPRLRRAALDVRGFGGAAEWMRLGLAELRGRTPTSAAGAGIGWWKYGLALALSGLWVGAVPWAAPLAVLVFYAVEAQMVFLYPVALDGSPRPFLEARALTVRAGGTVRVMRTVMPIATSMLFGGLLGRGFVRSWCVGCLAVCVWYERVR